MWLRHWKLSRNPFAESERSYVATPGHDEAVARLLHAIEAGERSATLLGPAGAGKTTVLLRALALAKSPARRVATISGPRDAAHLLMDLAGKLGRPIAPGSARSKVWRQLAEAVRVCHLERQAVVLAVDDAHTLEQYSDEGASALDRLLHLDAGSRARLTVIVVGRQSEGQALAVRACDRWELAARLNALTRTEAAHYVASKLAAAGRDALTFTDRALTRMHALAGGWPRGLNRLASLALMAGAIRGLEAITPEVVDGTATECEAITSR